MGKRVTLTDAELGYLYDYCNAQYNRISDWNAGAALARDGLGKLMDKLEPVAEPEE